MSLSRTDSVNLHKVNNEQELTLSNYVISMKIRHLSYLRADIFSFIHSDDSNIKERTFILQ